MNILPGAGRKWKSLHPKSGSDFGLAYVDRSYKCILIPPSKKIHIIAESMTRREAELKKATRLAQLERAQRLVAEGKVTIQPPPKAGHPFGSMKKKIREKFKIPFPPPNAKASGFPPSLKQKPRNL